MCWGARFELLCSRDVHLWCEGEDRFLVEQGCIPILCGILRAGNTDRLMVAFDALDSLLTCGTRVQARDGLQHNPYAKAFEVCDGLSHLKDLSEHEKLDVKTKAKCILQDFFPDKEEQAATVSG
jgi:importin subunit alpha-1